MEASVERECSALGGLFQQIISDMKNGAPLWEDLIAKATKLHTCLRTAIQAIATYLDAFQKIADAATNARGATKDIGTALTRICLRHKAVEARMKTFTSAIMDCLVIPLQEKLEDWKRTVLNLDKEHAKEYKRARTELKKRSTDTLRLQKKARKGKSGELQRRVETCLQDMTERKHVLEETEKNAVRAALIEERSRFCLFVGFLKPVLGEEVSMLSELTHIQEVVDHLDKISCDPFQLPQASEQVLIDLKGCDSNWSFQTPPSSPSSLGSRKSSMCSISSLNSSSSGSSKSHHSPNHYWHRSVSQNGQLSIGTLPRHSSISSQDSGFRSQDAFFVRGSASSTTSLQVSSMSEQNENNSDCNTTPTAATVNSAPNSTTTWPNLQETLQFERAATAIMNDRPHTISSAYERGHQRPSLTVYTFHTPETSHSQPASPVSNSVTVNSSSSGSETCNTTSPPILSNSSTPQVSPKLTQQPLYSRPPIPQRCSSLERPSVPAKTEQTVPVKTLLNKVHARLSMDSHQPPMYVNMSELASMAASKAQEMSMNLPPPPPLDSVNNDGTNDKTDVVEKDGSTSESSLESSSGYGSQTTFPTEDCHVEDVTDYNGVNSKCCTLPRSPSPTLSPVSVEFYHPKIRRPLSVAGYPGSTIRNAVLRKGSMQTQKPPPPIRRTASISSSMRQPLIPNLESGGSMENLPPPPAFLLDGGTSTESLPLSPSVKEAQNIFQGVQLRNCNQLIMMNNINNVNSSTIRVADTVRTLTELKHTPASPSAIRRATTTNIVRSQSAERRDSTGSVGLIAALSAKLTPTLSPRHSRRHSEDLIARNLNRHGSCSPVSNRLLQRGLSGGPGQEFLDSLNAKLAYQQHQTHKATRVRQLFNGRTISDPTQCHDSLMDQIKRGTPLKKTRTVNDRSAPKIH